VQCLHSVRQRQAGCLLFPYTTLFRSMSQRRARAVRRSLRTSTGTWYVDPPTRRERTSTAGRRFSIERRKSFTGSSPAFFSIASRSEEHTSELQSRENRVCRLLLEKKK